MLIRGGPVTVMMAGHMSPPSVIDDAEDGGDTDAESQGDCCRLTLPVPCRLGEGQAASGRERVDTSTQIGSSITLS